MGLIELATSLGMDKGLCSRLVKKGMPTSSAEAAEAWRAIHAKPRAKRSGASSPSPIKPIKPRQSSSAPPDSSKSPTASTDETDGPSESLRRAKVAERESYKKLVEIQRDKTASPEDLRKSSSVYFSSRSNRQRAESDHREFLRAEGITLFYEEATEICGRGHSAVAKMLSDAPKALTPRLLGMPAKAIESSIAAFCDKITDQLRKSF